MAGLAGHAQDDQRFARRDLNETFDSIAEEDALPGSKASATSAGPADSFPDTLVDSAVPPAASTSTFPG